MMVPGMVRNQLVKASFILIIVHITRFARIAYVKFAKPFPLSNKQCSSFAMFSDNK